MESYTADDAQKGSSAVSSNEVRLSRRAAYFARAAVVARRVLRRNADDLHAGAARDVHRVDDVAVLHLRITLHEDDLLRARIVDLLEPRGRVDPRVTFSRVDRSTCRPASPRARSDSDFAFAGATVGFGSGSWMSIAFRIDGSAAMKMISSTSSTSIIGVTLISFVEPAAATS